MNGDLGNTSLNGIAATGLGTGLGYGSGILVKAGATRTVQWTPVKNPTLPLTPYGSNVIRPPLINNDFTRTFYSPIPSQLGSVTAPFVQEFSTPKAQEYAVDHPVFQKNEEVESK